MNASAKKSENLSVLIHNLQNRDWKKRFEAGFRLGTKANELGEFADTLRAMAVDKTPGQYTAVWLLRELSNKTMGLWGHKSSLVCENCFVYCGARNVNLLDRSPVTYYGCPVCGQSRNFLEVEKEILAILDNRMESKYTQQDLTLRVNWLLHRSIFDFDCVEIIQATDEDVERFAMQTGNDTDFLRQPRYKQMRCTIAPDCELSENTMRILQRMFGQVEVK
ncbi:hypothetical protein ACFLXQ_03310 [Chloroflexota bacterium]